MMRTRVRVLAVLVGIVAAVGLTLIGTMPAHAATVPGHHRPPAAAPAVSFTTDRPGPHARSCLVQAQINGGPNTVIRYIEAATRHRAVSGRMVLDGKGRGFLPVLTVRSGERVRATAAVRGARPGVATERAHC